MEWCKHREVLGAAISRACSAYYNSSAAAVPWAAAAWLCTIVSGIAFKQRESTEQAFRDYLQILSPHGGLSPGDGGENGFSRTFQLSKLAGSLVLVAQKVHDRAATTNMDSRQADWSLWLLLSEYARVWHRVVNKRNVSFNRDAGSDSELGLLRDALVPYEMQCSSAKNCSWFNIPPLGHIKPVPHIAQWDYSRTVYLTVKLYMYKCIWLFISRLV